MACHLQHLEPETNGLDDLISAFDKMVQQQLDHPNADYSGSLQPKVETLNVPGSFGRDPTGIVVAYGEATPVDYRPGMPWADFNRMKKEVAKLPPVFWVAQRLDDSEIFCKTILSDDPISEANLNHLELVESEFDSAVSVESFRQSWNQFLRPDDLLVVANQQTIRLLRQAGANVSPYELLKAIRYDPRKEFDGAAEFLKSIPFPIEPTIHPGRAGERLAVAVSLVRYMRSLSKARSRCS